jgi:hypothetical protein
VFYAFGGTIPPVIGPDRHQLVHCRVFYDFTLRADPWEPMKGIMDFLPDLFTQSQQNSGLREAVAALAYASFARRLGQVNADDSIMETNHYGNALVKVKQAMESERTANSDELLMTVYLLGMFEVFQSLHCPIALAELHVLIRLADIKGTSNSALHADPCSRPCCSIETSGYPTLDRRCQIPAMDRFSYADACLLPQTWA